jgi:hypothetical protein
VNVILWVTLWLILAVSIPVTWLTGGWSRVAAVATLSVGVMLVVETLRQLDAHPPDQIFS